MRTLISSAIGIMLVCTVAQVNAQVTVTFLANTAGVPDTLSSTSTVQIRGDDGIDDADPANVLTWDGASTVFITSLGGDYWKGTVTFPAAAITNIIYFKFFTNVHDTVYAGADWEHEGWETDISGGNRVLDLTAFAGTDTTLPLQFVNGFKPGMDQYEKPYVETDSIDVWVRVNMQAWMQLTRFDPETQSVGVRGSNTTDWFKTGDLDWGNTVFLMNEDELPNYGGYFYSGRVRIPLAWIDSTLAYKFVVHNNTDLAEPSEWWDGDNITFTCPAVDSTLHWFFWNNVHPSSEAPVTGNILFSVDMSGMVAADLFDRVVGDTVFVHGAFNGWGHSDYNNSLMERVPGTEIYELVVSYTDKAEVQVPYKYFIDFEDVENRFPNGADYWGWEEPFSEGGGNRWLTFEGIAEQELPLVYFNDLPPEGVIPAGNTITLTMNMDMTPAMSLPVPFDPASHSLTLGLYPELWTFLLGRENGQQSDLVFEDPDGDNIFTLTWEITGPAVYGILYVCQYTGGDEEGGGYDYGRRRCRYIPPVGEGQFPSEYTFPTDEYTVDPPCVVESPPTGVELITKDTSLPESYVLRQNYPNPFNPATSIEYGIPSLTAPQTVTLRVYNQLGQHVATLVDQQQKPGNYVVLWDGKDLSGQSLATGIYMYKLEVGSFVKLKKMLLLK
jgi:hypothetical protein